MFDDEIDPIWFEYGLNPDELSDFCKGALAEYLADSVPDEPEFIPGLWVFNPFSEVL